MRRTRKPAAPTRAKGTDGLGQPVVPTGVYFIQDSREHVGNNVLWWRPNGAGYTCDIDDAGQYDGVAVRGLRDTDIPWPVDFVLARVARYVDRQRLRAGAEQVNALADASLTETAATGG
jgi:hypothetical protein